MREIYNIMKKKWHIVVFILLVFIMTEPYMANIMCATSAADDFWMLGNSGSVLKDAFDMANYYWHCWTGEWLYSFIQVLFNPLRLAGYSSRLVNFELVSVFVLFITAILFSTHIILSKLFNLNNIRIEMIICLFVVALVLNTGVYQEIFTWYVGSTYLLGVTLALICISLIIQYYKTGSKVYAYLISFIGFFSCMGIMIVSSVCLTYLFLFLPAYIRKQKRIRTSIPFFFCLAGGLIAVIAPGNYARHDSIDSSGLHFISAFIHTINYEITYTYRLLGNVILGSLLIGIFLISFFYARSHNKEVNSIRFISSILCYGVVMFTFIFPVALGYSSPKRLPNRIEFMIYTYAAFGMCILFYNGGMRLGYRCTEPVDKRIVRCLAFMMVFCLYVGISGKGYIGKLPYYQQIVYYKDSVRCHDEWVDVFNEIASSKEDNVVIHRNHYAYCNNTRNVGMEYHTEGSINEAVARYFGKESVRIQISEKKTDEPHKGMK